METPNFVRNGGIKLPIGFRFHPTDEELVVHYLKRKVHSLPLPASVIPELDVFHINPLDLPGDSREKRYFFNQRRRNANKSSGYWKEIGKGKHITSSRCNQALVGVRKTLGFRPRGLRNQWVMHEYRLVESETTLNATQRCMMEDWVVCCIYEKRRKPRKGGAKTDLSNGNKTRNVSKIRPSIMDILMEEMSGTGPPQPSTSSCEINEGSDQEETSACL